jgi:hypothetical protein
MIRRIAPERLARPIGILTLSCAVLGFMDNTQNLAVGLSGGFEEVVRTHGMTHFHPAFYAMSAVCLACYLALVWAGYHLARRRLSVAGVAAAVWLFEIVYVFATRLASRIPDVGESIAGATGVANGGLMIQFIILLPLWGPLAMLWLARTR